jgi:beta-1,4-mannosyltransferase
MDAFIFQIAYPPQYIVVQVCLTCWQSEDELLKSHQNPPTIPTLAIVWLVSWLRGSKVIIDWHNLGYTILAMRLGEKSRFVALAKK